MWKAVAGLCLILPACVVQAQQNSEPAPVPQWIWADKTPKENQLAFFRREFELPKPPQSALLRCIADRQMTVFVNGERAGDIAGYTQMAVFDVAGLLQEGRNVVAIRGANDGGPAGVIVLLDFDDGGAPQRIVSDEGWLASPREQAGWETPQFEPRGWLAAVSFGELGVQPWGDPTGEVDDYNQWKQALVKSAGPGAATDPQTLELADGFSAELLRSAIEGEGSWVSMEFDPRGRLIVARESQGLLRMTLAEGSRAVSTVEVVDDTLLECRGLLWAHGALYASANNSKGLYRLRDSDGDDQFDERTLIMETGGGVGHGRNDLALGPDGMIYLTCGNNVLLPDGLAADSPLANFAPDRLLPCLWDEQLFDAGVRPPGGYVVRVDATGRQRELVCGGFRNQFGIDFNADGELFTFDSDMEWDVGAPWYKPTRVYHLVSGGDYGWRQGTAVWPGWYADSLPPLADVGKGSPTAVKFGTHSSFPPPYREALYILDWSYGRILAVHLAPHGASYTARVEPFVKGRPLNVTDLTFGPDGAMYFITGGRGTQSGLYRVRSDAAADGPATAALPSQLLRDEAHAARDVRRKLAELPAGDPSAIDLAWPHLASDDPYLRHAARLVLERHSVSVWQQRVFDSPDATAALTGLLALSRVAPRSAQPQVLAALDRRMAEILDGADQADAELAEDRLLLALRAYALCFIRLGPPHSAARATLAQQLAAHYPHASYRVNHQLSELLVYLEAPEVVPKTLAALESATTQEEQMHYLFVLRDLKAGWTLDDRKAYLHWLARAATFEGAQYMPTFLSHIKSDWLASLSAEERLALEPLIAAAQRPPVDELPVISSRPFINDWQMADLADALAAPAGSRDLARGKSVFTAALCSRCHRLGGQGTAIGPDLTSVSSRFNRREVLESALAPSKVLDEKYKNLSLVTLDGQAIVGRLVGGDERALSVSVNPLQPSQTLQVEKSEIESQELSPVSPMPLGLLNTFTQEEILDLLAYIESGGE